MKKRLVSILFAMVMLFSFGTTAFADNTSLAPETGNLIIHKYALENMNEVLPSTQGELAASIPTNAKPVEGISFDVYKITVADAQDVPVGTGATYKLVGGQLEVTYNSTTTLYGLTLVTSPGTTDVDGLLEYEDLTQGYYFVVENLSTSTPKIDGESVSIGSTVNPFVVAVPMTNPTGIGWLTDVHVYPKNQPITIVKTVDKTSVSVGDEVTYTITPSIPSDIKVAKVYTVTDILDAALTYNQTDPATVTIKGGSNDGDPLTSIDDYSITYTQVTNTLVVDFTVAGRVKLDGATAVEITFKANVNEGILSKATNTVENKATVDFTNQYDQTSTVESEQAKAHTGQIKILKTKADKTTALEGAKFQIASSAINAENGNYLKKDSEGNIVDYGETGYAAASEWQVASATTSALAIFDGLADYIDGTPKTYNSYWIVETVAPEGYNLIGDPIQVTFDATATEENVYTMEIIVVNTTEFTLPVTGGMGTILFTVVGIALVGVSVILVISTRKKTSKVSGK